MPSQKCLLALLMTSLALATACGGGSQTAPPPPAPVFTSTPPTAASQEVVYSYSVTATDPAGGAVTFALSSGPAGAALSGNALAWTPAAAQSRIADNFTVTATTSEGGRATQSWSVTPSGTINGSRIDTQWTASGSANVPFDWARFGTIPQALIPQSDGSFIVVQGSVNSDGTFTIPNVPGGYYWLQIRGASYWTSSSTFDDGTDIVGSRIGTTPAAEVTTFAFNIDGLDPVESGDQFAFLTDWANDFPVFNIGFAIPSPPGSTTMTKSYSLNSNIDYSTASTGFLLQYEPVSAGSVTGVALGPELTISNLSLISGTTNNVDETLNPSPQASFDLSVKGSQWAPMFENAGPGPVTPVDAYISISARPFSPANVLGGPLNLPLFLPPLSANDRSFLIGWLTAGMCGPDVVINPQTLFTSYPPMLTDQDFGELTYGDPFDSSWGRVFNLCQSATVQVPVPGGGDPATFWFLNGVNTAIPTSPVSPLALPVQNPMINGTSFFTANTVSPTALTLSWLAPAGAKPFAYEATLFMWGSLPSGGVGYIRAGSFYTAKTSMTLPALQAGQTYVIELTTLVDGRANVETSPNRSALPTAVASVISAPITANSSARPRTVNRPATARPQ